MKTVGKIGGHIVALETDDFQAAVGRGRVFSACNQTGIATQAGLSLTEPVLTLYNPAGSGVKGRLWYAGVTFEVAAAAACVAWVAVGTDVTANAVTGTAQTAHRRTRLGSTVTQGNVIQAFEVATLPAIPVGIAILGCSTTANINTVPSIPTLGRWFKGAIDIMPGTNLSIQTSTASGALAATCNYIWEEVDL